MCAEFRKKQNCAGKKLWKIDLQCACISSPDSKCLRDNNFKFKRSQSISSSLSCRKWWSMRNFILPIRINQPSYLNSVLPNVEFFRKILAYLNAREFFAFKWVLQPIELFVCKCCSTTPLSRSVTCKKKKRLLKFYPRLHVDKYSQQTKLAVFWISKWSPWVREGHKQTDGSIWQTIWHGEQKSSQHFTPSRFHTFFPSLKDFSLNWSRSSDKNTFTDFSSISYNSVNNSKLVTYIRFPKPSFSSFSLNSY